MTNLRGQFSPLILAVIQCVTTTYARITGCPYGGNQLVQIGPLIRGLFSSSPKSDKPLETLNKSVAFGGEVWYMFVLQNAEKEATRCRII
jgi:hypothetical protein